MLEMLRPEEKGISGILELARMVIPSYHEFVGFEDYSDGTFYSAEQLEALEGQENHMDSIQKAIESLQTRINQPTAPPQPVKPERAIKRCFHFGDSFIVVANDDTVWHLKRHEDGKPSNWKQLKDARTPPLPQGEV